MKWDYLDLVLYYREGEGQKTGWMLGTGENAFIYDDLGDFLRRMGEDEFELVNAVPEVTIVDEHGQTEVMAYRIFAKRPKKRSKDS